MAATFRFWADRLNHLCSAHCRPALAAAGLCLAASSCQTPQPTTLNNGHRPPAPQVTSRVEESRRPSATDPHIQHAVVDDASNTAMIEPMAYQAPPVSFDTGVVQISAELPANPPPQSASRPSSMPRKRAFRSTALPVGPATLRRQ